MAVVAVAAGATQVEAAAGTSRAAAMVLAAAVMLPVTAAAHISPADLISRAAHISLPVFMVRRRRLSLAADSLVTPAFLGGRFVGRG